MGDSQRLSDTEQLEILALLETVSTERSAMRAARALAELMVISTVWGNASPLSCPARTAASSQPGASAVACFIVATPYRAKVDPECSRRT